MSQEKRNSKPFLKEFSELLVRKVNEAIQSEEFMADVYGINQRMVEHCGRILDELAIVIGARFTTKEFVSEETETGTSGRPSVSFDFKLTGSKEDQEITKGMRIDFSEEDADEVNQALEQARKARIEGEGDAVSINAEETSQPLAETEEAAKQTDPRNTSQIINSIREAARALNFEQRQLLVEQIRNNSEVLKEFFTSITAEQMKNDTAWLQCVQDLINEAQSQSQAHEALRGPLKETLLDLEVMFKILNT